MVVRSGVTVADLLDPLGTGRVCPSSKVRETGRASRVAGRREGKALQGRERLVGPGNGHGYWRAGRL